MNQYHSQAAPALADEFQPFCLAGYIVDEARARIRLRHWEGLSEFEFHRQLLIRIAAYNLPQDVELNVVNMVGATLGILDRLKRTYDAWKAGQIHLRW